MMLIRNNEARPCSSDDIKIRMGKDGTTMKTSAKSVMNAIGNAAQETGRQAGEDADTSVAKKATKTPIRSEFCVA